ncbi:phosphate acetyltransferase [Cloacibacterium normanense]|uniref:phosphate acetyltransferase n=1 Tax=Cloacibacterium normanense TaxID=237258 RepID=UPI000F5F6449|nr:phosphate acetyltransferase [Cloacibacterium normanense]AZI70660.1 phosphate acetyltransferase [Cloacibacterium normanense]
MNHSVYVITSSAQSGKSIVSLGLMQMLKRTTPNVAFFKPLIENKNVVDNHIDTILSHFNVNMNYEDAYSYSRSEFTEHQNQGKINEVYDTIIEKYKNLENEFDFVLVEGSDFTEEGSVFEIDFNGSIAKNLGIPVLLVVKDSFETVPELVNNVIAEVNSFLEKDVNIIGVIVNRCEKEQREVQKLINKEIKKGIFVAVIPNNPELGKPSIREIINHIRGHVLFGKEKLDNIAKTTVIGAMQLANFLPRITPDSLCIMPGDRSDLIVGTSLANISPKYPNISGIVLIGGFTPERSIINLMLDNQKPIPIITTNLGTFEAASVISRIKPKIYAENKSKIKLSIDLFESSVDVEELNTKINSVKTESLTPRMFQYNLLSNAKKIQKHIVLPEGNDDRILTAASQIAEDKVAKITILGDPEKVKSRVAQLGLNWDESRISIVDPHNSEFYEDYANTLYELRKSKGLELTSAQDLMLDASYFGTMMVHKGHADGMVSGAVNTTAHTIKPALQFVKTKPGFKTVSSVFFMLLDDRVLVYGDCAIVPNPNPEQLAEIAISSADSAKTFGIETPKVAMLSYSSGTSGSGEEVEKVRKATEIVKSLRPDILVEGPIQYDAAVDPIVGKSKLPNSPVAGQANVLIFPDLNTGNNTYKAVQRETGALAVGPMLQGLNKPINDLSRGATIEDIYNTVIITAIQSTNN